MARKISRRRLTPVPKYLLSPPVPLVLACETHFIDRASYGLSVEQLREELLKETGQNAPTMKCISCRGRIDSDDLTPRAFTGALRYLITVRDGDEYHLSWSFPVPPGSPINPPGGLPSMIVSPAASGHEEDEQA